jgi:predicted DNA-binding transcriptional regulator YafY
VTELPGGQVRLSFRLGNLEEIERWILSWGPHATAIKPRKLVQRLRKAIHELAHRYHHHSEDVD